jgi:hypothetical protein
VTLPDGTARPSGIRWCGSGASSSVRSGWARSRWGARGR